MSTRLHDAQRPTDSSPHPASARDRGAGQARVRGALIVNPYSSGMTSRRERAIVTELRRHIDLEVRRTERGGHAPRIAEEIVASGSVDVLIACGGDGTANEVLNGMSLAAGTADDRPSFAIIPAGGTNVLARSEGLPNHPLRATIAVAEAIVAGRSRTINLATVDERVFMFSAGVGLDAEVVKRIEARRSGRRPSDLTHFTTAVGIYASSRWALGERITITVDDTGEQLRAALALVGNTNPMTYMGRIPVQVMPDCTLDTGLDFIAPRRANVFFALRYAAQSLGVGRSRSLLVSDSTMQRHHDVRSISIECDDPQPVQADGEYLGERTHIRFALLEDAVRLVV